MPSTPPYMPSTPPYMPSTPPSPPILPRRYQTSGKQQQQKDYHSYRRRNRPPLTPPSPPTSVKSRKYKVDAQLEQRDRNRMYSDWSYGGGGGDDDGGNGSGIDNKRRTPSRSPSHSSSSSSTTSSSTSTSSSSSSSSSLSSSAPTTPSQLTFYKTELCCQFAEYGYCDYGDRCLFAHGSDQLKPLPPTNCQYKVRLCANYHGLRGYCSFGNRCKFIHSRHEATISWSSRNSSRFRTDSGQQQRQRSPFKVCRIQQRKRSSIRLPNGRRTDWGSSRRSSSK
ncbi:zinc finger protein mex-6-like [Oppia nitens]|uniref:zinc finger protein mex-6-like n=1 Tax=Oppia nitens TaxID=1686743 RepID=UPI0023DBE686|nr:zinc finger protein mex-6-like [Oppia nitens]